MVRSLQQGNNIALFHEGFMSIDGGLGQFKRGGLHAAASAKAVIVRILLLESREICKPGDYIIQPGKQVPVVFGEPIASKSLSRVERKSVHQLVRNRIAALRTLHEPVTNP